MCNVQLIALILLERIVEDMLCSEFFQDWLVFEVNQFDTWYVAWYCYSSFSMADNFVIDIGRQYEYTNVCTCR